jgi:hypothetical protein
VQRFFERLGITLCVAAGAICVVLHLATFVTVIPLPWILLPFASMFGAVLAIKAAGADTRFAPPTGRAGVLVGALFLYGVFSFVCFYRTTGGASSVRIQDGQYVSMYKSHVIRTITEEEYRMFPNL